MDSKSGFGRCTCGRCLYAVCWVQGPGTLPGSAGSGPGGACREELNRQLRRHPDWHEGRTFLVELEIENNNLEIAAGHLLELARAGQSTAILEKSLVSKGSLEPLAVLEQAFADDWHWPRQLYIRVALKGGEILPALSHLIYLADRDVDVGSFESGLLYAVGWGDISRQELSEILSALEHAFDDHWHWPRLMYVKLAIEWGDYASALAQLKHLAQLGADTCLYEDNLLSKLGKSSPSPDVLALLEDGSEWSLSFSLRYTLKRGSEEVLPIFQELKELNPAHPVFAAIWDTALNNGQLALAWKLALHQEDGIETVINEYYDLIERDSGLAQAQLALLNLTSQDAASFFLNGLRDLEGKGYVPSFRTDYVKTKLIILQDYHRTKPITRELVHYLEPGDIAGVIGCSWEIAFMFSVLSALEDGGADQEFVRILRSEIVNHNYGEPVVLRPDELLLFEPGDLWTLACNWYSFYGVSGTSPGKESLQVIVDYLGKNPQWKRYASNLNAVINPLPAPPPAQIIDLSKWREEDKYWLEDISISPNGRYLFYYALGTLAEDSHTWCEIVDLKTGKPLPETIESEGFWSPVWNMDSRYLSFCPDSDTIIVYDAKDKKLLAEIHIDRGENEEAHYSWDVLGWSADNLLLWNERNNEGGVLVNQVVGFDPATGRKQNLGGKTKAYPKLTATGKLAFLTGLDEYGNTKQRLYISVDGGTKGYDLPSGMYIHGWLPGDTGLLLSDGGYSILDLASSGLINLDLPRCHLPMAGWINRHQVHGYYMTQVREKVMLLDIRDMSLTVTDYKDQTFICGSVVIRQDGQGGKIQIFK